jgi:hypothetical protein
MTRILAFPLRAAEPPETMRVRDWLLVARSTLARWHHACFKRAPRIQLLTEDFQIIVSPGFSLAQWFLLLFLVVAFGLSALYMGIASVPMVGRI